MSGNEGEPCSEIIRSFETKSVFITGASGFVGKVLLYKLLSACTGIGDIYVLLRDKKGLNCVQRLHRILENECFSRFKKDEGLLLNKIKAVSGDITQDGLGIGSGQLRVLQETVSIVIHSAATIKFNEILRDAVNINLLGTRRLIKLAQSFTKLEAFVHVSTAYSNCHLGLIENRVYDSPIEPQQLINLINSTSDEMIEDILPRLLEKRPNTYTLTKALTESLIVSESGSLPIAIVRPSIVTAAASEPSEGWTDNLNNVTGIAAAMGSGVLRTMSGNLDERPDLIPVDMVVNTILATAHRLVSTNRINQSNPFSSPCHVPVINCSSGELNPLFSKDFIPYLHNATFKYPDRKAIRSPSLIIASSKWLQSIIQFTDQWIPFYLMDLGLTMTNKKPTLIKLSSKLNRMVEPFSFFTNHSWTFRSDTMSQLFQSLNETDQKLFTFDVKLIDWPIYIEKWVLGIRKFMDKDYQYLISEARGNTRRKLVMERGIQSISLLICIILVYQLFDF